jgi:hypothetical protein
MTSISNRIIFDIFLYYPYSNPNPNINIKTNTISVISVRILSVFVPGRDGVSCVDERWDFGGQCRRGLLEGFGCFRAPDDGCCPLVSPAPSGPATFFPPSASAHVPGRGPRPPLLLGGCAVIAPGRPSPSVRGDWAEEPSVATAHGRAAWERNGNGTPARRGAILCSKKMQRRHSIYFLFESQQIRHHFREWTKQQRSFYSALPSSLNKFRALCACHKFNLIHKKYMQHLYL